MEATLRTGNKIVEFDVAEGSHIYLRGEDGQEFFFEWAGVGPELRVAALACRAKVDAEIRAATGCLIGLL